MNIAFFEIKEWEVKILKKALGKTNSLLFTSDRINNQNLEKFKKELKKVEVLSVFIYSKIDKTILDLMPKIKIVATRSTGFDHIDLMECKKRQIEVTNVPFYGENTVAEHTFALILSLSRNIHKSYVRTLKNDFSINGLEGFDLKNKTIGIVGAGHIGLHVAKIAKSFGMKILVFDVKKDKFMAEMIGFKYAAFNDLLASSDIISLHVPYNQYTHHLINQTNIQLIKKGSLLINTARGKVVQTEALIEALDKKILRGAGLDVLEDEELIMEDRQLLYDKEKIDKLGKIVKDHILLNMDNVVFTPHIAFYSREAQERIISTTIENILSHGNKDIKTQNLVF